MLDPISQAEIWSHLLDRSRQGLGVLAISHNAALLMRIAARQHRLLHGLIAQAAEPLAL
jgi:peptide/nickel transport system ATP-binding protein